MKQRGKSCEYLKVWHRRAFRTGEEAGEKVTVVFLPQEFSTDSRHWVGPPLGSASLGLLVRKSLKL